MASIKKVAQVAGVSVGTVSHVITGTVPVSEALRDKVVAAIRELNYHPNHVARSLKTSKTRTLGILVPDLTISFFPQVIRGAETAARTKGYSLLAVNSTEDADRQRELLSLLRSQRVEGILLVIAAGAAPLNQISRIADAGIPVVFLDRVPDRAAFDSVCVENLEAAAMGVEHLIAMGNRRIAAVTGPLALRNERRRLLGYRQALEAAGMPLREEFIWEGNLRPEDVARLCRARLSGAGPKPDALFCTNGPTALGALRALGECGLRTPEDLAFVTFDELMVDDLFRPSITTIVQPAYDIGFRAAELLLQRIERPATPSRKLAVRLPAALKIRESSQTRVAAQRGLQTASAR
jgi:DNA-binding LacI/PurR family transcriptional regulator